jgi:hypothetical protein
MLKSLVLNVTVAIVALANAGALPREAELFFFPGNSVEAMVDDSAGHVWIAGRVVETAFKPLKTPSSPHFLRMKRVEESLRYLSPWRISAEANHGLPWLRVSPW